MRFSTYEDPGFRAHVTDKLADVALEAVVSAAVPWPTGPRWWDMQEPLNENLAMALNGDKTAQQALDDTQAIWEQILGK